MSDISTIVNVAIELNSVANSGASFGNALVVGPRPSAWDDWAATTAVTVGDLVVANGHVYRCTTAGTTGSVAPSHTTGTATDGTATWLYVQDVPALVGVYANLTEVSDAGWKTSGTGADPVGIAARVAFSQTPRPEKLYIAPIQYASGTTLEEAVVTVQRAMGTPGWYGVALAGVQVSEYEAVAAYIETTYKIFGYTVLSETDPVGNTYFRTFADYGKEATDQQAGDIPEANAYLALAHMVKCFSYQPGSETWVYKTLAAIAPSKLNSTKIAALDAANIGYFETVAGVNLTRGGKVKAGEWIDLIRFRDWLQDDMQTRIVNLLIKRPKIPYTNPGISLVENQMIASLKAGQDAGGISPDQYDKEGILIPGFTVKVPNVSVITDSQRASRILTNCTFEANIAGAIHMVKINGALVYSS